MKKFQETGYKEVNLDGITAMADRTYRNPLAKTLQYEYALYLTVADLFGSVRCRSMCIDRLKLYFSELGHRPQKSGVGTDAADMQEGIIKKCKNTREDMLSKMEILVKRDVIGHINFPMMNICTAAVRTIPEKDGTHSFIFTDGIYGFRLHLETEGTGSPKRIRVTSLRRGGDGP